MKFEALQNLSEADFRTLTGFKRKMFDDMVSVLRDADAAKMKRGGRPHKNSIEDRLLMSCQYWREYRSYLHIGVDFGVSKGVVCDTIRWVEDVLIQSGKFRLPGKKVLREPNIEYQIVVIDASESPICRPKKTGSEQKTDKKP